MQNDKFELTEFLDLLTHTKTHFEIEYFLREQVVAIYGKATMKSLKTLIQI